MFRSGRTTSTNGDLMIYENATISIEAVRTVLEREGHFEVARKLRGIEVSNAASAAVALDALQSIRSVTPEGRASLAYARSVLTQAAYEEFLAA